jgi:hypothetical protein
MHFLLISACLGGVLTATLVWRWQGDWMFVLLLAPIGSSFATLLAAAFLTVVRSSSARTFLASQRQRWWERKSQTKC